MKTVLPRSVCYFTAVAFAAGVFNCATNRGSLPTAEQLVGHPLADVTQLETFRYGRSLAVTECATCHRFFWPHEYPPTEWPQIIRNMGRRASLDEAQINALTDYFVSASQANMKGNQ